MKVLLQNLADQWRATTIYRWYSAKSTTDQRILKALTALCALVFFYIGCAEANFADEQQRRAALPNTGRLIAANRQALVRSGRQNTANTNQTVRGGAPTIAQITSSAAQFGITLSRLQPESDGSVSVGSNRSRLSAAVAGGYRKNETATPV